MKKSLRRLHQALAYLVGVGLILLALTGFLLNHTQDFGLDSPVKQTWLNDWYQVPSVEIKQSVQLNQARLTQINDQWFWQTQPLPFKLAQANIYQSDTWVYLLNDTQLTLLTSDGDWVETLPLPDAFSLSLHFPVNDQLAKLETRQGLWQLTSELEWQMLTNDSTSQPLQRQTSMPLPKDQYQALMAHFPSPLTYEKVVLELHNFWFFGPIGPWLLDGLTLLILLMVFSGWVLKKKK